MQHCISMLLILVTAAICFACTKYIGYKVVALILLMAVSVIAMLFDILPVLLAAILSAIIWNFFFIPPTFTFHINDTEDVLMFFLYFFIALINAVLTFNIREAEKKARDKEEKENSIKLYNTLLNSLSHELKTPIATIIGNVDVLKDHHFQLTDNHQHDLLTEIEIASVRLNKQVENLLNMSRLETGMLHLNLDWCDVDELINSVINKLSNTQTIIFNQNNQLPLFKLDIGLMDQVIHNLIANAVQYTPSDAIITIDVTHNNHDCIITITDNGNGFPETEIPFVFNKFYRLPNTQTGGSGLGLSIVKGFVEAHHGTVHLENIAPHGAKFTIAIPAPTSFIKNLKNE